MFERFRKPQYHFFGGKGGVGKTTLAASFALKSAKKKRTLIISTDPAHSLSDSFEFEIGPRIRKIKEKLWAIEIDPKESFKEYKEELGEAGGLKQLEMLGFSDELALGPGIDEAAALNKFMELMESDFEQIIFDTAPSGHTLRFLSLPEVMNSWLGKLIKLKIRFSKIADQFRKILPFAEEKKEDKALKLLEELKLRIGKAKKLMQNPSRTSFNLITTPEKMSILETERDRKALNSCGIEAKRIIVNKVLPKNPECKFCSGRRSMQHRCLKEIERKFKEQIIILPLYRNEIKGFNRLNKIGSNLW